MVFSYTILVLEINNTKITRNEGIYMFKDQELLRGWGRQYKEAVGTIKHIFCLSPYL